MSNIFSLRRIINKNTVTHFRLNGRVGLEPLVVMAGDKDLMSCVIHEIMRLVEYLVVRFHALLEG